MRSLAQIRFLVVLLTVVSCAPRSALCQASSDAREPMIDFPTISRSDPPKAPTAQSPLRSGPTVMADAFYVSALPKTQTGIDWKNLLLSSANFLAIEHTFRYSTEDSTRYYVQDPSLEGYVDSVTNLHGWGDGDEFMVNYIGHPMQGAVSNFMWQHNDRAYRTAEFGRNRRYWKAKLRGMAFAFAYSTQFEIGPVSEASLGNVQARWPQFGLVDLVVTPTIGTGWAVGEDAVDRMFIQRIETRVANPYFRVFLRGLLNPARSFSNTMNGKVPWSRDDRPGVFKHIPEYARAAMFKPAIGELPPVDPPPGVAPFEFSFDATARQYFGNTDAGTCIGGGGTAGFRLASNVQLITDVGGCRVVEWKANWSGDTLSYVIGPRWTVQKSQRWIPHFEILLGGMKITQEYKDPIREVAAASMPDDTEREALAKHYYYTTDWDDNGFTLHAGGGLNFRPNHAFEIRLATLEYEHTWLGPMNGIEYRNAIKVSGGLVVRMGTW